MRVRRSNCGRSWSVMRLGMRMRMRTRVLCSKLRRGPAVPVRTHGEAVLEVPHDHFGKQLSTSTIPLKGKLHIGPSRVRVPLRIAPCADALADIGGLMPELKVADWYVSVANVHPPSADRLNQSSLVAVIGSGRTTFFPFHPSGCILQDVPIGPVDTLSLLRSCRNQEQ